MVNEEVLFQWAFRDDFKGEPDLRQEVKDQRIRIEEAARRQRALDVEADLASVPLDWRS